MVLFLFLNDFLTMSLSTDRMAVLTAPEPMEHPRHSFGRHRPRRLASWSSHSVSSCTAINVLRLDMPHLQTLMFATLILSSQAGVYLLRERGHFWQSRPSRFLVGSSRVWLGVSRNSCARRHSHAGDPRVIFLRRGMRWNRLLRLPRLGQGVAFRPAESALTPRGHGIALLRSV